MTETPAPKPALDWAQIRAEYESGASANELGRKHGCSHTAVLKRARKEDWKQDVEEAIRRRVSQKVSGVVSDDLPLKRAAALDAEAERRAEVVRRHREEPNAIRALVYEGLKKHKRARNRTQRAAAFDDLKAAKITSETLQNLHRVERKAWGLDAEGDGDRAALGFIRSFHDEIRANRSARREAAA